MDARRISQSLMKCILVALAKWSIALLIVLIGASIVHKSLDYIEPDFSLGFLWGKELLMEGYYGVAFYTHIISAPIILFAGLIQFLFTTKTPSSKIHRILGWIYIGGILLFASPSAFVMGFHALGGLLGKSSFILLAVFWFYSTLQSLLFVKQGNIPKHREWMLRSYTLSCSALTLRCFSFINALVLGNSSLESYAVISWLSWMLPWLFLESILWYQKKLLPSN